MAAVMTAASIGYVSPASFFNGINLQCLVAVVVDDVHRDLADRRRIERATG
jgi:hypothetical protein